MTTHWTHGARHRLPTGREPPWDMPVRENLIRAKVAELTAAGATAVCEEFYGEHLGHVVMLDPERNEFYVA